MLANLKDVLIPAQKGGYAVGLFNTTDTDMLEGVISAAEEMRSPVIIGTAHGAYKSKPKLDIKRLSEIRVALDTPLVLHGGSGLSDDDFKNTIKAGIAKVNIFTDLCLAGKAAIFQNSDKEYLEIRNKKVEAIKQETIRKMKLFASNGKA